MTIALGLVGGAGVGVAGAQSGRPAEDFSALVSRYIAAWNTHDPIALGRFFTADADMIMGNGPMLGGRSGIQSWWHEYFDVQEPERTLTIEIQETRAIATGVAVVNVRTITGGRTTQGIELPRRTARGTWILVRRDSAWLITAMRGMPTQQDRIIRGGG